VVFEDESDLEILERAARALAERARRDAENVRGTTIEKIHRETQSKVSALRRSDQGCAGSTGSGAATVECAAHPMMVYQKKSTITPPTSAATTMMPRTATEKRSGSCGGRAIIRSLSSF
jgi:hypothetical protein